MLLEKYCFETWYLVSEKIFTLISSFSLHKCINGNNNEKYCLFYRFFNLFYLFFSLHHSIIHSRVVYASCSSSKLHFIKIIIWNRVDKNENKKKLFQQSSISWKLRIRKCFCLLLMKFQSNHWEIEQYWFDLLICRFLQLVQYYIHLFYLFAWLVSKCVSLNDW